MDIGINIINPKTYKTKFRDSSLGPTRLTSIMALSQKVAKLLLTAKGSDYYAAILDRSLPGTDFNSYIASVSSSTDINSIFNTVNRMVESVEDFIRKEQTKYKFSLYDTLEYAKLTDVRRDENLRLVIEIEVGNAVGETFRALISQGQVVNFGYLD